MQMPSLYASKHFSLQQLDEGVFAAIAADGGAAISNSGLLDLGGRVLVFDTFLTPQAALDLRLAAMEIFGRSPDIVINSHYHNDHIWGNQVFEPEAQIISSARTRHLITTEGAKELEWCSANSAELVTTIQAEYEAATDDAQRSHLLRRLGYYKGLVEALPGLTVCLPNITFADRMEIYGSHLRLELMTYEEAHTGSDSILFLPAQGIVFMSDLMFVGCHPYLPDGDPLRLLQTLEELSQLKAERFVPGHGELGTADDLRLLKGYIEYCTKTAQDLVEAGDYQDKIQEVAIPEQYQDWKFSQFFAPNLSFLCERFAAGG